MDTGLPVPIDLIAENPVRGSGFVSFRIQTWRIISETDESEVFQTGDDPFEETYDLPHYVLFGVCRDGTTEHIAERGSFEAAVALASNIAPGIKFQAVEHND